MKEKLSHFRVGAVGGMAFALAIAACVDEREPTGPADPGATKTSSQHTPGYPEERRSVELARVIPGFAGFFYDTSGNIVVSLKDLSGPQATRNVLRPLFRAELSRARVRHPQADVLVRDANHSFLDLKEWRDDLNGQIWTIPGVVWLDLDEVKNRVVMGLDVGVDPGPVRFLARGLGIPELAVEFEVTKPYVPEQTLRDEFRPIEGGIQIQRVSGTGAVSCTLGFAALWNNQQVFLTAGHCSPNVTGTDNVAQFQPRAPLTHADSATISAIGREILQFSEPCGSRRCSYSDAALYGLVPSPAWGLGRIAQPVSGCFPGPCNPPVLNIAPRPYWVIDTTYQGFVVNDLVSKIGSATGWSQGSVSRTCVDVSPSSGVTYRCQMFATYGADDGDSGAPILLDIQGGADSTVTLGGIHSGRAGSNRVFSPWSGIVQDYGSLSVLSSASGPPFPATAPDSVPNWLRASSLWVTNTARVTPSFVRDLVLVRFTEGATLAERQAAIDLVGGTVVGGVPFYGMEGVYYVQLPTDSTNERVFTAIATLQGLGQVEDALPDLVSSGEFVYRRPSDGPGMQRGDWRLNPDSAFGQPGRRTWALEAVNAPNAWGCSVGDTAVRVAVLDGGLRRAGGISQNVIDTSGLSTGSFRHGTLVASVLAARGDDSTGTTGMMWRAGLLLYSNERRDSTGGIALRNGRPIPDEVATAAQITRALANGARVVNISVGVNTAITGPHTPAQDSTRAYVGRLFRNAVLNSGASRPVIVLATGNAGNATDVYWSSFAAVADYLPGETMIVTGADLVAGSLAPLSVTGSAVSLAAPAIDVAGDSGSGQAILVSGTSFAAPLVSGLAGLLFSFDPRLGAQEVRQLILDGAQRGGRRAGQYPLANAYESLKLAAQRPGAPLCGNRVWVNSNAVIVERDATTHTTEQIISLGAPASFVNARHGGRRIEVSTDTSTRAFELRQGQWVETPDTATTGYGGTFLSMQALSHDLDSVLTMRFWTTFDSSAFELTMFDLRNGTNAPIDTLWVPTRRYSGAVCVRMDEAGACEAGFPTGVEERVVAEVTFPPAGGRVFVAVTYFVTRDVALGAWQPCPQGPPPDAPNQCRTISYEEVTERALLWAVDVRTGQETSLWPMPARAYWFGVSEDGTQVVSGEGVRTTAWAFQPKLDATGFEQVWSDPGTVSSCGVRYRSVATGAEIAPAITTSDACTTRGVGTVAPAPPHVGSP